MKKKSSIKKDNTDNKKVQVELVDDKYLEKVGSKLSLVKTNIEPEQMLRIFQRTPKQHIYSRPAKGGGTWDYVTGTYVKKVLNYIFGWMWDFEVKEHGKEGDLIWVLGKLTIKNKDGKAMIVKEQFGRADIKYKKNTKIMLDYGNDLKSASTDALKKCASELGVASDIYGKTEFKDIQLIDLKEKTEKSKVSIVKNAEKKLREAKKIDTKIKKSDSPIARAMKKGLAETKKGNK